MVSREVLSSAGRSLGIVLASAAALLAALEGSAARADDPAAAVAAIFPPWWDEARVLSAAAQAGRPIRLGAAPFVVVVAPDVLDPRALRRAGALALLDPDGLAGCGPARPILER